MENWESSQKEYASQRSATHRVFPRQLCARPACGMLSSVKAMLAKGAQRWPAQATVHAQTWPVFSDFELFPLIFLFFLDRHSYCLVCQEPLAFLHHSFDSELHLSVFQAPSPAENGLSGLLESKFLISSNDSESL